MCGGKKHGIEICGVKSSRRPKHTRGCRAKQEEEDYTWNLKSIRFLLSTLKVRLIHEREWPYLTLCSVNYIMDIIREKNHELTPGGTVLAGKLTGPQLLNKSLAFYGTRRFITTFTTARHFFLP